MEKKIEKETITPDLAEIVEKKTKAYPIGPVNATPQMLWKMNDIFETYLLMGEGRSLVELSKQVNVPYQQLKRWSRKYDWFKMLEDRKQTAAMVVDRKMEKVRKELMEDEIRRQHVTYYQEAMEKAAKALSKRTMKYRDAKDATIALDVSIKGMREASGMKDRDKAGAIAGTFTGMMEAIFSDPTEVPPQQ